MKYEGGLGLKSQNLPKICEEHFLSVCGNCKATFKKGEADVSSSIVLWVAKSCNKRITSLLVRCLGTGPAGKL